MDLHIQSLKAPHKKYLYMFFTLMVFILNGCTPPPEPPKELEYGEFNVEIWQHGKKLNQTYDTYELDKAAFDVRIEFSKEMFLMVSADYRGDIHDQVQRGVQLNELNGFILSGMAEELGNTEQRVILSKQFPSVWYYSKPTDSRCNEVIEKPNRLICVRTIKNIRYEENSEQHPIEDYPHSFIYMTLFSYNYDRETRSRSQISNESFILSFRY